MDLVQHRKTSNHNRLEILHYQKLTFLYYTDLNTLPNFSRKHRLEQKTDSECFLCKPIHHLLASLYQLWCCQYLYHSILEMVVELDPNIDIFITISKNVIFLPTGEVHHNKSWFITLDAVISVSVAFVKHLKSIENYERQRKKLKND